MKCVTIKELLVLFLSGFFVFVTLYELSCDLKQSEQSVNFVSHVKSVSNEVPEQGKPEPVSASVASGIFENFADKLNGKDIFLLLVLWVSGTFFTKFAKSLADRLHNFVGREGDEHSKK